MGIDTRLLYGNDVRLTVALSLIEAEARGLRGVSKLWRLKPLIRKVEWMQRRGCKERRLKQW